MMDEPIDDEFLADRGSRGGLLPSLGALDEIKVQPVARQVIDRKLLTALEDEGVVAIMATEADLTLLVRQLYLSPERLSPRVLQMCNDLKRLREEAFG